MMQDEWKANVAGVLLVIGGLVWLAAIWAVHATSAVAVVGVVCSFSMISFGLVFSTMADGLED